MLKRAWREGEWEAARVAYNTWTNRTGRKRDARIEGEMVFRMASTAFQAGNHDRALSHLDDLLKGSAEGTRVTRCRALCLARKGKLRESGELFEAMGDRYHASLLSDLDARGARLPPRPDLGDPAFEQSQLLSFWQNLADVAAPDPTSTALRSVRRGYQALLRGEEPDASLDGLRQKPGCEDLAVGLVLVAAVALRRTIKVRNILSRYPELCGHPWSLSVIDGHLQLLLGERDYREIEVLEGLCAASGLRPHGLERARDERLFAEGLQSVEAGRWEEAWERFVSMERRTPAVFHNLALLCQKTGRLTEANEHWVALLRMEKMPKRSDPEGRRLAYVATARAIAANYIADDEHSRAIPFLKEAHVLSENDPAILSDLVDAFLDTDAEAEALVYARKWYAVSPKDEEAIVAYIMALLRNHHTGTLVALFEEAWMRSATLPALRSLLTSVYGEVAWGIRDRDPRKAREIVTSMGQVASGDPFLSCLEGHFLATAGEREAAAERFDRVIEEAEDHSTQVMLGTAMYDEGFREHGLRMFEEVAGCGCGASQDALYDIVETLAQNDDRDAAVHICAHAVEVGEIELYFAADSLLEAGRPAWAREFSGRLAKDPEASEDDHFLHLLILNACGDAPEALAFAERSMARFRAREADEGYVDVVKDIVKQLKSRGRARIPYD